MTIWYKTHRYDDTKITEVDIFKSTSARVWFSKVGAQGTHKQTWEAKRTEFHQYFTTKPLAVAYLLQRQRERIIGAKWEIQDAEMKLSELRKLYVRDGDGEKQ